MFPYCIISASCRASDPEPLPNGKSTGSGSGTGAELFRPSSDAKPNLLLRFVGCCAWKDGSALREAPNSPYFSGSKSGRRDGIVCTTRPDGGLLSPLNDCRRASVRANGACGATSSGPPLTSRMSYENNVRGRGSDCPRIGERG
jgi:hypothetical protein